jgi:LSD1 subclass zinc finger protein
MVKIVEVKCPKCGAPLMVPPGAESVSCQYCGAPSFVDRGRAKTRFPQGPGAPAMNVVHVAPPNAAAPLVVALVGFLAVTGAVAGVLVSSSSSRSTTVGGKGLPGVLTPSSGPRHYFDDRPMLADVNGDGAPDIIGKSSIPGAEHWIAAYDGRTLAPLWKTAVLSKDASDSYARRAIMFGRVLSADSLGKLQAYDLRTGTPAWSALLGEKAKRMCQGDGTIVVETVDEARRGFDPQTGKPRDVAKNAPCAIVQTSVADEAPGYQLIGWWKLAEFGLPGLHDVDGISAHRALVPSGPGPRFLLGGRSKGSSVAMVAAVDKKKVLWKDVVPGVDPLTTDVNVTTQQAAYSNGLIVIPYSMKDHDGGVRMACFDGMSGKRLWDVEVHKKTQVSAGMNVSSDDVLYASWTALYVISLRTGKLRGVIGTEF